MGVPASRLRASLSSANLETALNIPPRPFKIINLGQDEYHEVMPTPMLLRTRVITDDDIV